MAEQYLTQKFHFINTLSNSYNSATLRSAFAQHSLKICPTYSSLKSPPPAIGLCWSAFIFFNRALAHYMLSHPARGPSRGSYIMGCSVHNSRIARLWRDVYQAVLSLFYDLFNFMESDRILDPDNEHNIFCLHVVFQPVINDMLSKFSRCLD